MSTTALKNGFKDIYLSVFQAVKTILEKTSTGNQNNLAAVILGEAVNKSTMFDVLPIAVINADKSPITGNLNESFELEINFSVYVVVLEYDQTLFRQTRRDHGVILDALLQDMTLTGTVTDCVPTSFSAGTITFAEKTYYDGEIKFQARKYWDATMT